MWFWDEFIWCIAYAANIVIFSVSYLGLESDRRIGSRPPLALGCCYFGACCRLICPCHCAMETELWGSRSGTEFPWSLPGRIPGVGKRVGWRNNTTFKRPPNIRTTPVRKKGKHSQWRIFDLKKEWIGGLEIRDGFQEEGPYYVNHLQARFSHLWDGLRQWHEAAAWLAALPHTTISSPTSFCIIIPTYPTPVFLGLEAEKRDRIWWTE